MGNGLKEDRSGNKKTSYKAAAVVFPARDDSIPDQCEGSEDRNGLI